MKLSGVILLTCAGLTQANLLYNPGFEIEGPGGVKDADGWFQTAGWVERLPDTVAPSGDYVLQVGDSDDGWHWASQNIAVTPGVEYTFSTLIKAYMPAGPNGDDDAAFILYDWLDAGGASLGNGSSAYDNSSPDYADFVWVSRSVIGTAPAGAVQAMVRALAYMPNDNGTSGIWFDNVEAIPEPATMGLFGLMGGGLLWVRKRFKI